MTAPIVLMLASGFFIGICLAFASAFFHVKKDPRIEAVNNCLSGANCGACGYAGCSSFAAAIVKGEELPNRCTSISDDNLEKISHIININAEQKEHNKAIVKCIGGANAADRYEYAGIRDCQSMSMLMGGIKRCIYGCLGGGSCIAVCSFNAIKMGEKGLPIIDQDKCTGCGVCVLECPRHIIKLIGEKSSVQVLCSSHDKGAETRKICVHGCTGCGLCKKKCSSEAISVSDSLAQIDANRCTLCGECISVCPVSAIYIISNKDE